MSDRSKIRDPALAVAVAKCWLARTMRGRPLPGVPPASGFHAAECPFCDYDLDGMIEAIEEFVQWSGISSDDEMPMRLEIESFLTLPAVEQARLVRQAQGS